MEISLIFPHQLFETHPALERDRLVVLVEDALFFGGDPHWGLSFHKQKLILHRASMKAYVAALQEQGYEVQYLEWQAGCDTIAQLQRLKVMPSVLHFCDPVDDVLSRRLQRLAQRHEIKLIEYATLNFVATVEASAQLLGQKKPFMATFYKAQRQHMQVLMEDDGKTPKGGKWSFDEENRKKLPKKQVVPEPPSISNNAFVMEAESYVTKVFPEALGYPGAFGYPVTRADALKWLEDFFHQRFHLFGDYEDAIATNHRIIFHSVITPSLNIGLLNPQEVVTKAVNHAEKYDIPLNSLEGFIRQIIGWREFMRLMYVKYGVQERNSNFWGFSRKMPTAFYDGTTGVDPIDETIHRVLETGYCHHIERLMLLGNFMLLCRIHPDEVYRWFMELFIDSYDWVMVPNVYGMSQFADGGIFTTKPYVSGSNYVRKMSNYKKGDWCEIWDDLFWSFIGDHHAVFASNARMSRMTWMYDKMASEKKEAHHINAEKFLAKLD